MRILVVRNDKLGDFMLAWPALRLLKEQLPEARIVALVPEYTRAMAELCPWIDEIVIDTGGSGMRDTLRLGARLRRFRIDHAIVLFSTARVVTALAVAGIKERLGPATKVVQLLLTDRLRQRRSHSAKPEFEYNADLARHFLEGQGREPAPTPTGPFLRFPDTETTAIRRELAGRFSLPVRSLWLFVHPGSGGSANNLSPEQYSALCFRLAKKGRAFILTAGPGEIASAREIAGRLSDRVPTAILPPSGLPDLARSLSTADLFISGSTGPLHIAGALDRPTATFYPGHRSGSPLRWQTMNRAEIRLAFTPPRGGDSKDVSRCDIAQAAEAIDALLTGL